MATLAMLYMDYFNCNNIDWLQQEGQMWKIEKQQQQECIPVVCVPLTCRSIRRGGYACPGDVHTWGRACPGACMTHTHEPLPPLDRILGTRLWKHYLPQLLLRAVKMVATNWNKQITDLKQTANAILESSTFQALLQNGKLTFYHELLYTILNNIRPQGCSYPLQSQIFSMSCCFVMENLAEVYVAGPPPRRSVLSPQPPILVYDEKNPSLSSKIRGQKGE